MFVFYLIIVAMHLVLGGMCFCFGSKDFRISSPGLHNVKGVSLIVAFVLFAIAALRIFGLCTKQPDLLDYGVAVGVVGVVIFLVVYCIVKGELIVCPVCSRMITPEETSKEFISSYTKYENVKRQETVRDKQGRMLFTVEKDETAPVEVTTHRHHYRCGICGHQWAKLETT